MDINVVMCGALVLHKMEKNNAALSVREREKEFEINGVEPRVFGLADVPSPTSPLVYLFKRRANSLSVIYSDVKDKNLFFINRCWSIPQTQAENKR